MFWIVMDGVQSGHRSRREGPLMRMDAGGHPDGTRKSVQMIPGSPNDRW